MLERDNKSAIIDNTEKYRIYSKTGILSVLRLMLWNNCLATCHFGRGDSFVLTTVLDVDAERSEMVLDYGADETLNQQALKAGKLNVMAFLDQVKIQFACHGIQKIEFEGHNAFLTRIPETLLRMQKREYYRIVTPTIAAVRCTIPLPEGNAPATTADVILQNISCGGMAVIDPTSSVNFEEGAIYRNCLLALPGVGTARVNIRIQHVSEFSPGNGLKCQRARCEYIATDENILSMIQRYITRLELEQKRKQ